MRKVRVWDLVVRTFHWFSVSVVTLNSTVLGEGTIHEILGYALASFLCLRVIWGFVGSDTAKFVNFFPTWAKIKEHVSSPKESKPTQLGHNPIGALMIFNLIITLVAVCLTGHLMTTDRFWGSEFMEDLHEGIVNYLCFSVTIHVAGVFFESFRSKVNLIEIMITGKKQVD